MQAANPIEWGYPATYLHGPALRSGWAVANCISAYGGGAAFLPAVNMFNEECHHTAIG